MILMAFGCKDEIARDSYRPNIILILTDDQGFGDMGIHGNPDIITPNLDSLASESVRFDQFYVSPVCAPTRASLLTGKYALSTGVYEVHNGGCILDSEELTLAELLQEAGYHTSIFGKWHLGDNYPFRPEDQGFQEVLIHLAGGIGQPGDHWDNYHDNRLPFDQRKHSYFNPILYKNGKYIDTKGYCTDLFTDAAIDYIETHQDNPFFIYLSYNAPHDPYQVPQRYLGLYDSLIIHPDNYGEAGQPFRSMESSEIRGDFNDFETAKRVYAMMSQVDDNVGRLRNKLTELNLEDNTLIIFMSDNGPQWGYRYNAGLKGAKGTILEGGSRVPCYWYYPAKTWVNKVVSDPVAHIDVLPTLANLCNSDLDYDVDGINLGDYISKEKSIPDRYLFNEYSSGLPDQAKNYWNVSCRKGDFKYVAYDNNDNLKEHQLYDISNDPKELIDIASDHPEIIDELKIKTGQWYKRMMYELEKKELYTVLGSPFQDTVILNRSEWKGSDGRANNWNNHDAYGTWDVEVRKQGNYTFIMRQRLPWPSKGELVIELNGDKYFPEYERLEEHRLKFKLALAPGRYSYGGYMQTIIHNEIFTPDYVFISRDTVY
jgi:arylsulfatase